MESKHHGNIANFEKITLLLDELGAFYNPSQPCLSRAALLDRLEQAKAVGDEIAAARTALRTALDARQRILYDRETGILRLVKLLKTELARRPGKTSPVYRHINALEFRKYR